MNYDTLTKHAFRLHKLRCSDTPPASSADIVQLAVQFSITQLKEVWTDSASIDSSSGVLDSINARIAHLKKYL